MRAARDRSTALAAIAEIRRLQSRAGEIRVLRAKDIHRAAKERHDCCAEALKETQARWAEALQGASFDPNVARIWFAALEQGHAEERLLEAELQRAQRELERDRAAWQGALARSEAAHDQASVAARRANRQREDARVAALEDCAAARWARG